MLAVDWRETPWSAWTPAGKPPANEAYGMEPPEDFPAGYRPKYELGEGSMGAVWLAWSQQAGGHVAVKVLNLRRDRRGSSERSFNREVRAMARVFHPSIVGILDFGRTPKGSPFVAMEYVPGTSLAYYIREPWSWPMLWTLLDSLLSGLAHAHARDLIHRDLKPGNVLVVPDLASPSAIKLADFGIAIATYEAVHAARRIEGTPAYIAPEAASGEVAAIGPWTDLYSLGVMLYEILSGERPFHGRHLLSHHRYSEPPPLHMREEVDAPEGLIPIVERLLAKSPTERFRSAAAVREAVAALGAAPRPVAFEEPDTAVSSLLGEAPPVSDGDLQPATTPAGPGLFHLRQPPITGRGGARRTLANAAQTMLSRGGTQVVLLEGDAGLGKSRLSAWIRERLEEAGRARALLIRSEPQVQSGDGLRDAVLRFIGAPAAGPADGEAALREALGDEEVAELARDTLYGEVPHSHADQMIRSARLVRALGDGRPLLVVIEDAHWSPEGEVLRLVHRLAVAGDSAPLLVVVTLRPSQRTTVQSARSALLALDNVQHVGLTPMTPTELVEAMQALGPLPDGVAEAAAMLAAGNPLIALEAVRGFLQEEGLSEAPRDPGTVLQARVDATTRGPGGGELRSALARATLLGRSFSTQPLARLCAVAGDPDAPGLTGDPAALELLLERALDAGLIIEQGSERWRFNHDLVRDQFKQTSRRLPNWAEINRAAAELKRPRASLDQTGIELEVVARHYREAGDGGLAMRMGRDALTRLHGSGLMGHAASFGRKVLDWDDQMHQLSAEERGELLLLCSEAAEHAGQPQDAERRAHDALGIGQRNYLPALASRAASRLGGVALQADDLASAENWLVDALRFARRSGDARARCLAHLSLGRLYQHQGLLDSALMAYQASLESARTGELSAEALTARAATARLDRLEGRLDKAEAAFERIAAEATESGLEVPALEARLNQALCAFIQGEVGEAKAAFADVRKGAHGNLFTLELFACVGEAWAVAHKRRWTEVELLLMQAQEVAIDVTLRDPEAEQVRLALRELAVEARRPDIVARIDKLEVLVTRTHSTTSTRTRSRG